MRPPRQDGRKLDHLCRAVEKGDQPVLVALEVSVRPYFTPPVAWMRRWIGSASD